MTKKLQDIIDDLRQNYESDKADSQDKIYVQQGYIIKTKKRVKLDNSSCENDIITNKK